MAESPRASARSSSATRRRRPRRAAPRARRPSAGRLGLSCAVVGRERPRPTTRVASAAFAGYWSRVTRGMGTVERAARPAGQLWGLFRRPASVPAMSKRTVAAGKGWGMLRVRSAVLGMSGVAFGSDPSSGHAGDPSPVVPLMILVLGLAVATMWFVALPALDTPAGRTCEVVFLKSGTTKCIEPPAPGMRAVPPEPSHPADAERRAPSSTRLRHRSTRSSPP